MRHNAKLILFLFLAVQDPGQSSNSSEVPFTPSIYISTPRVNYNDDPYYNPPD